jgi:hypothetical protein
MILLIMLSVLLIQRSNFRLKIKEKIFNKTEEIFGINTFVYETILTTPKQLYHRVV